MADTDQNLCPHCGQPMPEAKEETLGTPTVAPGTNTVAEENQKEAVKELSWESETVEVPNLGDDTPLEEIKEESLPEEVEKLDQQIKEYEEENEDPDVENPQNEH